MEREVQRHLADQLRGMGVAIEEESVYCASVDDLDDGNAPQWRRIDIVTPTEIIEVKNAAFWRSSGIGQILLYQHELHPTKTPRLHLFYSEEADCGHVQRAARFAEPLGIRVTASRVCVEIPPQQPRVQDPVPIGQKSVCVYTRNVGLMIRKQLESAVVLAGLKVYPSSDALGGYYCVDSKSYVDLLTEAEVVQIEPVSRWRSGFGKLVVDKQVFPNHTARLHLFSFDLDADRDLIQTATSTCARHRIQVTSTLIRVMVSAVQTDDVITIPRKRYRSLSLLGTPLRKVRRLMLAPATDDDDVIVLSP